MNAIHNLENALLDAQGLIVVIVAGFDAFRVLSQDGGDAWRDKLRGRSASRYPVPVACCPDLLPMAVQVVTTEGLMKMEAES